MPANNFPIYTNIPVTEQVAVTAINTKSDGSGTIGTDLFFMVTAGANGLWLAKVRFVLSVASGTPTSAAALGRVFVSSQSSGAVTATQAAMIGEAPLAAQIYSLTAALFPVDIPVNQAIKPGSSILVSTTVAPTANTVWKAIGYGGQY